MNSRFYEGNQNNSPSGGKLLLISDLEGCMEKSASGALQARFMCDPMFFNAVAEFLASHPKNKVAFLGDYFDQGDKVVDSINGIMGLYKKFKGRVHLIVGNRDVNKFRLVYEMMPAKKDVGTQRWGVWKGFYENIVKPENDALDKRFATILSGSMGTAAVARLACGLNDYQAAYLLLLVFSKERAQEFRTAHPTRKVVEKKNGQNLEKQVSHEYEVIDTSPIFREFIKNARDLYLNAKIVHYDPDFKTLMSHAGGMDTFFFHEPDYYTMIETNVDAGTAPKPKNANAPAPDTTYYGKMEVARKWLMEQPTNQTTKFEEGTYNSILTAVAKEVLIDKVAEPSSQYFLLQALGLKPDGSRHFTSFIQSCDNTGCKGPAAGDSGEMYSNDYARFQDILVSNENNVKVLASGHVPHCAPVPLVYKRKDVIKNNNGSNVEKVGNLFYALNDTSNGYRPIDRVKGLESYPLTYVKEGGTAVGVGMLPALEPVDMSSDAFGPMFGEWTLETAPVFNTGSKQVEYAGKGALTFPARPEKAPPGIFKPAVFAKSTSGGGRRRRATRKGRKASRKGRKTRRQ